VSFNAVAGLVYQIAVEGVGDGVTAEQGNLTLSLVTTPANDQFANRTRLNGTFAEAAGYNIRATRQTGEPNHGFADGQQSVWWTWTAPASGNASITTWGSSYDTAVGVYTGTAVNILTPVASNDDESFPVVRTSKATFAATAGTAYHFAVDGFLYTDDLGSPAGTDVGLISITLSLDGKSQIPDRVSQRAEFPVVHHWRGVPERAFHNFHRPGGRWEFQPVLSRQPGPVDSMSAPGQPRVSADDCALPAAANATLPVTKSVARSDHDRRESSRDTPPHALIFHGERMGCLR
jgi:hypothetical protein